jgi:hypothetical protein
MAAWEGFTEVTEAFHEMQYAKCDLIVSTDFTKMDTSVRDHLIPMFLAVHAKRLQGPAMQRMEETIQSLFKSPTMISMDKVVSESSNSLLSGSEWTNYFESIIQLILHYYVIETLNRKVTKPFFWAGAAVLGDDGVTAFKDLRGVDYPELFAHVASQFGLNVNPEKQSVNEQSWKYLQRFFHKKILNASGHVAGIYPGILALNTAMFPERYHNTKLWGPEMETLRWLMILENCDQHPYFHQIIDFFRKGDKYDLGLKLPGFFDKAETYYREAKSLTDFVPTYTTSFENRGIYDFAVVKYLRKYKP